MTMPERPAAVAGEQTRARYPDESGYVERDGVRVFWERYGDGEPTVLLLPTWTIVHSRCWKAQIPYLARHFRVLTFDPRGNGRSARPPDPRAYAETEFAADALAVMDATDTNQAVLVSLSMGAQRALLLGADHADRVEGLVFLGPAVPLPQSTPPGRAPVTFTELRETYTGWEKFNQHYWLAHYEDFLEFFFGRIFSEPHSTKHIEDGISWGLETDADTLIASLSAPALDEAAVRELASRIDKPSLVIHGTEDDIRAYGSGAALAELLGASLVTLEGSGHNPQARDPVRVNLLLRDFIRRSSFTADSRQLRATSTRG